MLTGEAKRSPTGDATGARRGALSGLRSLYGPMSQCVLSSVTHGDGKQVFMRLEMASGHLDNFV